MSTIRIISLLDDPDITLASGKRVFSKEETGSLLSLTESVKRLNTLEQDRQAALERAQDEARQRGHAEGLQQGRQEAQAELAAKLLELEQNHSVTNNAIRDDVVSIAMQVVRKIASGVAPEKLLVALAADAAAEHLPRRVVSLKVHPDCLEPVRLRIDHLKDDNAVAVINSILADDELKPEDCVLETSDGKVHADLETQLREIEQHLTLTGMPRSASAAATH